MRTDLSLFSRLADTVRAEGRIVLASVVGHAGSTPGKPGQKMLVRPDGSIDGTVGGGSFEAMVVADALEHLAAGGCGVAERTYRFSPAGEGEDTGMVCGGTIRVLFERLLALEVLVIFGGGHIGKALAAMATLCDFEVVIADDREVNLDPAAFPAGTVLLRLPRFGESGFLDRWRGRDLYAVAVTRCWETDLAVVEGLLTARPPRLAYTGMIGSKRKVGTVWSHLRERGYERADWESIHAPIGLDIQALTPAEIAVAILGQIVDERNRRYGSPSDSAAAAGTELEARREALTSA